MDKKQIFVDYYGVWDLYLWEPYVLSSQCLVVTNRCVKVKDLNDSEYRQNAEE